MQELQTTLHALQEFIFTYIAQIISALLILFVGIWIAKGTRKLLNHFMQRRHIEATVRLFTCRLTYLSILTFFVIAALAKLGIETTSIIAVIGALGLAVGLALKNSLSDFAAGILLIMFRPFKVGDVIDTGGATGLVEEINLLFTHIKTSDGKALIIPNGKLTGSNLINYSTYQNRRVEINVGISYADNIAEAKSIITEILKNESRIIDFNKTTIGVQRLSDSNVQLLIRFWTANSDFDAITYGINETIKVKFEQAKITIPTQTQQIIVNR